MHGEQRLSCYSDKVSEVIKVVWSSPLHDIDILPIYISLINAHSFTKGQFLRMTNSEYAQEVYFGGTCSALLQSYFGVVYPEPHNCFTVSFKDYINI